LPRRIVYDDWDALFPAIDGKRVVWEDYRNDPDGLWNPDDFLNDNADIYIYDIADETSYPLCRAPGPQFVPRISGDLVVWEDWRDLAQSDIHLYDLSVDTDDDGTPNWKDPDRPNPDPAEVKVTDSWWSEQWPDVSGRQVVWMDLRRDAGLGTTTDIYLRDLDGATESAVVIDPLAYRMQPRVDGERVSWTDLRHGYGDVYWTDAQGVIGGAVAGSASDESLSDVSGDRLVYAKHRATVWGLYGEWAVYNVWVQEMLENGCVGVHTFSDVTSTHWAWEYVEAVVENGVAQGYGDTYQPGLEVTRDQMAVYVARAEGWVDIGDDMATAPELFLDVPAGHWAGTAIEACVQNEVVEGYDPDHYGPEVVVTRAQMPVFIARAKGWVSIGDDMNTAPQLFGDVPAGYWSGTAIEACVENGVVQGYEDGTYKPELNVSRDQMAVYISRAYGYLE
jgi:beta propeller repeat protein